MRLNLGVEARVEARKPQRTTDRERQRGGPAELRRIVERPEKQDQRWRDAERDRVGQAVQLGAELAFATDQARDAARRSRRARRRSDHQDRAPFPNSSLIA
jgi:hypothetical protein